MCTQYFSETAHNPETNQRPGRLKTAMTSGSELRFHHRGRDSSPIYQNVWDHHQHRSNVGGTGTSVVSGAKSSAAARFVSPHRTPSVRRSSVTDTNGGGSYPHHRNNPTAAQPNNPSARHSMDIGVACRDALQLQVAADSSAAHYRLHRQPQQQHSGTSQPDDSVIMSRIKKSLEQKEEFLRRPVVQQQQQQHQHPQPSQHPAKEFYARPQKLLPPMWPPSLSTAPVNSQPQFPECSSAAPETLPSAAGAPPPAVASSSKPKGKQFVNTLGKIHEDGGGGGGKSQATAGMQVVSMRAKQFESGKMDDKTDFYKSELARLTSKHNVPNVAVRKMEYEQKLYTDKKHAAVQQQEITDDSITSYSSE